MIGGREVFFSQLSLILRVVIGGDHRIKVLGVGRSEKGSFPGRH